MEIKEADGDTNRKAADNIINEHSGADFYLLPELWSTGYCHAEWFKMAREDSPKSILFMQNLAQKKHFWIGGTLIVLDEKSQLKNRFILIDPSGEIIGHYDKSHLFTLMDEHLYITPGNHSPIFNVGGFKIAPTICYDLRFPEMYRRLVLQGVDIFLVSAEWPMSRKQIMMTLAHARAIESQAYLVLSNRVGLGSDKELFAGHSMVIDPTGGVESLTNEINTTITSEVSKAVQINAKKLLPVLEHRVMSIDYD